MVRKITAILVFFAAISCGTKDKVEGVKGEKGDKGEKGESGRDGQDGRSVQVTPAPVPTYYPQPVPQPAPQPQPIPYPVPMPYPVPVPQPTCDQCVTVCACIDNRWQTISIHQSQVGNYTIRRFGSC